MSATLVVYACYRKRPFTRFVKGSDIPNEFIKQKILQRGVLQKIEATKDGPLLLLRHRPPFPLPSLSNKTLPVKVVIFSNLALKVTSSALRLFIFRFLVFM